MDFSDTVFTELAIRKAIFDFLLALTGEWLRRIT